MKKISLVCLILAASLAAVSCGKEAEETASTTAEATTVETTAEETVTETTVEETVIEGPVELTRENFFEVDPAISDYGMSGNAGDIIGLVDLDYLNQDFDEPYVVDSIEDLASVTYLVNAYPRVDEEGDGEIDYSDAPFIKIDLVADLDLTGYEWVPLGRYIDYYDDSGVYSGIFIGNGHTISGLEILDFDDFSGFFGETYVATVIGLNIEDATVHGVLSGVLCGYNVGTNFIDCHATGTLPDRMYAEGIDEPNSLFQVFSMTSDRYICCSVSATEFTGTLYEDEFTINQYEPGSSNVIYEFYDPEFDDVFDYSRDYFFDS